MVELFTSKARPNVIYEHEIYGANAQQLRVAFLHLLAVAQQHERSHAAVLTSVG